MWYVCTLLFPIFLSQCISEIGHQELYDGLLFPSMPDGVYIPTQQSRLWHFGKNYSGWCSATSEACMMAMVPVGFVLKYKLFNGRRSYMYWYIFSVRFDWTKILPNLCKVRSFHRYVFSYWNFDVIFGKFVITVKVTKRYIWWWAVSHESFGIEMLCIATFYAVSMH